MMTPLALCVCFFAALFSSTHAQKFVRIPDMDYRGPNLVMLPSSNVSACRAACLNLPACNMFEVGPSPSTVLPGRCWLKEVVPLVPTRKAGIAAFIKKEFMAGVLLQPREETPSPRAATEAHPSPKTTASPTLRSPPAVMVGSVLWWKPSPKPPPRPVLKSPSPRPPKASPSPPPPKAVSSSLSPPPPPPSVVFACSSSASNADAVFKCTNAVRTNPEAFAAAINSYCDYSAFRAEIVSPIRKPLAWSPALGVAATIHTNAQIAANTMSHQLPGEAFFADRITAAGYRCGAAAENVAWGQRSALEVVMAWTCSAGHRNNIFNCDYNDIGVGAAQNVYTQDFACPAGVSCHSCTP